MAILSKYISLFLCLAIISILCACNLFEEEVYLKPMPVFASVDEAGAKVSDEQLHQGYTVIFLPCQDEYVNNGIAGRIEEFARIEKLEFNKLAVKDELSKFTGDGWRKVVDTDLRRKLESRYPAAFALIFEENQLIGGLLGDSSARLNIKLDLVTQSLYKYVLKLQSHIDVIESHRPENYISPNKLFQSHKVLGVKENQIIFLVSSASNKCEGVNILVHFQNIIKEYEDTEAWIILDGSFSNTDIESIKSNFGIYLPIIVMDMALYEDYERLKEANYSDSINMIYIYRNQCFEESLYVNNCSSLEVIM